jgi:uncharacterized protein
MEKLLEKKYNSLQKIIRHAGSATIAFSGGVDSTFLFKVCIDELGDQALAVTASSETYPERELEEAKNLATLLGGKHIIIKSNELEVKGFSDNPPHRCFLCKTELFSEVKKIAGQYGIRWVFDGSNVDDGDDFRPGRLAAHKLGVRSPLEEAGLKKDEIRTLSKQLNLLTWNKPSLACLSSRFPYYTKITRPALRQVGSAEKYLWQLGMRVFRVRHHDTFARIELGQKEMRLIWAGDLREKVVRQFKALGYKYVALDLDGYRSGSMNEVLTDDQRSQLSPR